MTIDERLEKLTERHEALQETVAENARQIGQLQHFVAGLAERWKTDREEDRALWRETRREMITLARRTADTEEKLLHMQDENDTHFRRLQDENDTHFRRLREEMAALGRQTDERIERLVSAIARLADRMPG